MQSRRHVRFLLVAQNAHLDMLPPFDRAGHLLGVLQQQQQQNQGPAFFIHMKYVSLCNDQC